MAYAGLPFRTRQDLHARVGDSIFAACDGRPEEFSELLSLHYFYAGRWSRSWLFSQMAGDRAKEIYANHEAAAFYQRALQAAARLDWVEPPIEPECSPTWPKFNSRPGRMRRPWPPCVRRSDCLQTILWLEPVCDSIWPVVIKGWTPCHWLCVRQPSA